MTMNQTQPPIESPEYLETIIRKLTDKKVCMGNSDLEFLKIITEKGGVIHNKRGNNLTLNNFDNSHNTLIGKPNAIITSSPNETIRHVDCSVLLAQELTQIRCDDCQKYRKTLHAMKSRENKIVEKNDTEIHNDTTTIDVSDTLHSNLVEILKTNSHPNTNSFGKVFWQEQLKNLEATPNGRRWHPLIIKWCLYLHHMSSGAYKILQKSNCLVLPSDRTLRDYTHFINNKPGFSTEIDHQLIEETKLTSLKDHEKYVCLIADEMKIKESLVFDKHQNELIGFTNLGEINDNIDLLETKLVQNDKQNTIATSVFVIMVRGLITKINFPYATFPTHHLTGESIAPIMMEETFRLERLGLKVIIHTMDGCSINRKYFRLMTTEKPISYKTSNPFTTEKRDIYFISDPPHLLKTTRNCLYNPRRKLEVHNVSLLLCKIILSLLLQYNR